MKKNFISSNPMMALAFFVMLFLTVIFYQAYPNVLSLELMKELNLTTSSLSYLASAMLFGTAIANMPIGILTDMFGPKKIIFTVVLIGGLTLIIFSQTSSAAVAISSRFLAGFSLALTIPLLTVAGLYYSPQMFGKITSIILASASFGIMMANAPLVWGSQAFGWRNCLLAVGIFGVLQAVMVLFLLPGSKASGPTQSVETAEKVNVLDAIKTVCTNKSFLLIGLWSLAVPTMSMVLMALWWAPYLMQGSGLSQGAAGSIISVVMLASIPVLPFFAYLSDNVFKSRKKVMILSASLVAVFCPALIILCGNPSPTLHLIFGGLFYLSTTSGAALAMTIVKELFPSSITGTALGIYNILSPLGGAILQILFGVILQSRMLARGTDVSAAYQDTLFLFVFLSAVGLVSTLLIKETFPSKQ